MKNSFVCTHTWLQYVRDSLFSWISDGHVWVHSWLVLTYRPEQLSIQRLLYFPCVSLWLMATEMRSFVSLIIGLWDASISFDFSTQWYRNSILTSAMSRLRNTEAKQVLCYWHMEREVTQNTIYKKGFFSVSLWRFSYEIYSYCHK